MSAEEFLRSVNQAIYLILFGISTVRLVRRPGRATLDTFLFFAVIAVILVASEAARMFSFEGNPVLGTVTWIGVSALPYLLLRLADDLRPRPLPVMAVATVGFALVSVVGVVAPQPWDPLIRLIPIAFVAVLGLYASLIFLREAARSVGVTRRRMQAVALGSGLLAVVLALAGVRVVLPDAGAWLTTLTQLVSMALVVSYFIGFAPPPTLRRAWQEPALRAMLSDASDLSRLPDAHTVAERIQERVVEITGADGASIGLWDSGAGHLVFRLPDGEMRTQAPGEWIGGRAFARQELIITANAERDAPEHASEYRARGISAIVAAPITAEDARVGVLIVYAARAPLFTDDVAALVSLMAEQAALVLLGQQLLQEAAQVRAQAEITRLKDDFLSVVAHDVRTPLTTILLNAELLQRAVEPESPDARRMASLRTEALRLKALVEDYLDVVRTEQEPELRLEQHDLVNLVRDTLDAMGEPPDRLRVSGEPSVVVSFDAGRIQQLIQNLVSNALKYSEADAPVDVEVSADAEQALLVVTDRGIGIPEADTPHLFERFHRGTNTDDRRYAGLGLGLYICRQIAEEHGGSIEVASRVGGGSIFTVRLPREATSMRSAHRAAEGAA